MLGSATETTVPSIANISRLPPASAANRHGRRKPDPGGSGLRWAVWVGPKATLAGPWRCLHRRAQDRDRAAHLEVVGRAPAHPRSRPTHLGRRSRAAGADVSEPGLERQSG